MRKKQQIVFHDKEMDIPVTRGFVARQYDELIFIKYDTPYCQMNFTDKMIAVEISLQEMLGNLPKPIFFACNRSFIINLYRVREYKKDTSLIVLKDGNTISLSRHRAKDFIKIRKNLP